MDPILCRVLLHIYQNTGVDDSVYIANTLGIPLDRVNDAVGKLGPDGLGLVGLTVHNKWMTTAVFYRWIEQFHKPDAVTMGHIIDKVEQTRND